MDVERELLAAKAKKEAFVAGLNVLVMLSALFENKRLSTGIHVVRCYFSAPVFVLDLRRRRNDAFSLLSSLCKGDKISLFSFYCGFLHFRDVKVIRSQSHRPLHRALLSLLIFFPSRYSICLLCSAFRNLVINILVDFLYVIPDDRSRLRCYTTLTVCIENMFTSLY